MTNRTNLTRLLDDQMPSVRAKLAAAWTSFMFLYIYVDYLHLYKPGVIDELRSGVVFVLDISPMLLTGFLASVAIPSMMVVLSMALPARVSRLVNLIAAAVYIPYSLLNASGETWEWVGFYAISITLEVLLLVFILRAAWRWPRTAQREAEVRTRADAVS